MPHLKIQIVGETKPFSASMPASDLKVSARPNQDIKWSVKETRGFPRNAVVFLRFVDANKNNDDGCLVGRETNHGRHPGKKTSATNHVVDGHVAFGTTGPNDSAVTYRYQIWYYDPDDMTQSDHMLMDPEIIVEGSPDMAPPDHAKGHGKAKRQATKRAAQVSRKKASKKSSKKKSVKKAKKAKNPKNAGRAKKAKKAKRATKRKAKKR